jgi:hypothetical protein
MSQRKRTLHGPVDDHGGRRAVRGLEHDDELGEQDRHVVRSRAYLLLHEANVIC